MSEGPFLTGVILAAGASTRMGRPKQLLPLGDRCLLQHVLDAACASCLDEIVLVLGACAEEIRAAVHLPAGRTIRVVVNAGFAQGQSGSLHLGLREASARAAAAAILLGDQPGVRSELIDTVAGAFAAADSPIVRPLFCAAGRRVPGHPVFLARRIWAEVAGVHGDLGARELIAMHPDWVLEVDVAAEPPPDIDTWDDYTRSRSGSGDAQ